MCRRHRENLRAHAERGSGVLLPRLLAFRSVAVDVRLSGKMRVSQVLSMPPLLPRGSIEHGAIHGSLACYPRDFELCGPGVVRGKGRHVGAEWSHGPDRGGCL